MLLRACGDDRSRMTFVQAACRLLRPLPEICFARGNDETTYVLPVPKAFATASSSNLSSTHGSRFAVTQNLFAGVVVSLILGAAFFIRILSCRFVENRFTLGDRVEPGSAGAVAIMFSLFLAFSTSDISQRSRDLSIAVQKEVSVARSIVQFSDGVGASAAPVRQALVEYLQAVTALEQNWLEHSDDPTSPAQDMADTMVQVVTLFVVQSLASPSIKSLILTKVDEMRQARTERIALSRKSSGIAQWLVLTLIALTTQFVVALGYVGRPNAKRTVVCCFTAAAVTAMCYLAWNDGLIGPSKIALSMEPLKNFLAATVL